MFTNINYNFFLHFGTPTTEGGVVRLSNSAASTAAVGTTEQNYQRQSYYLNERGSDAQEHSQTTSGTAALNDL